MNFGPNAPGLALGVVVLIAGVLVLPGRRLVALRAAIVGAVVGAAVYPLALCLFMGVAAALSRPQPHAWVRFRHAFSIYARSAPGESVPRGAVVGAFVVACWVLPRRSPARPPNDPPATPTAEPDD